MLFCPWSWRVVEVPLLGALAQSGAMMAAIVSFAMLGPAGATVVLLIAAILMWLTDHSPTMMSCVAEIPVVWGASFILNGNDVATVGMFAATVVVNSIASGITCDKEPAIEEFPRFLWQSLASTTVFSSCITIKQDFPSPAVWVAGIGFVVLWVWALFAQPETDSASKRAILTRVLVGIVYGILVVILGEFFVESSKDPGMAIVVICGAVMLSISEWMAGLSGPVYLEQSIKDSGVLFFSSITGSVIILLILNYGLPAMLGAVLLTILSLRQKASDQRGVSMGNIYKHGSREAIRIEEVWKGCF